MDTAAEYDALLAGNKNGSLVPQVISTHHKNGTKRAYSNGCCGMSTHLFRQVLAASGPVVATIGSGMTSGFSAVLLPQLNAADSTMPISDEESSWIASMAALPMALGCLAGGYGMEKLGRRRTNQLLCLPFIAGWLLMAMAHNVELLIAGRFLTGLAVGTLGPVGLIYIGETSAPKYRGVLLAAVSLAVSTGILISHLLGALLHWRLAAALCTLAPFIALVLVFLTPESPAWLASHGHPSEAQESFRWLRGFGSEAAAELQALMQKQHQHDGSSSSSSEWLQQLLRPSFVKPFLIMNVFFFIQQFSGVNAVAFYTVAIFQKTLSGGSVDEYVAMAVLDTARLFMSLITCVLLRRLGRRPLALVSAAGTGLSLLGLAAFLRFGQSAVLGTDSVLLAWTPVLLLVAYMCFVSIGLVPLPWVMTGEVFPAAVRGVGSGSTSCLGFLVFFVVVKSGPAMFAAIGSDGTFAIYGLVAAVGGVFLYFFCPETKNRTLQEIENAFEGKQQQHPNGKV